MKVLHFPMWEVETLLFPPECIVCSEPGIEICVRCRPPVQLRITTLDSALPPLLSGHGYDHASGKILLQAKEANSRVAQILLARSFAGLLAIADGVLQRQSYAVLGIPSTPHTIRRRGYLHLNRTLRFTQRMTPIAFQLLPVLRSSGGVRDQTELSAIERAANVSGKFSARLPEKLKPESGIILVDDVVSTGSSMRESVRALKMAGIEPDLLISAYLGRLGHSSPSNRMSHGSVSSNHRYQARGGLTVNRKRSA